MLPLWQEVIELRILRWGDYLDYPGRSNVIMGSLYKGSGRSESGIGGVRTEYEVGATCGRGQFEACGWLLEAGRSRNMSPLKPSERENLHRNNAFRLMMPPNGRKDDLLQQQQESTRGMSK